MLAGVEGRANAQVENRAGVSTEGFRNSKADGKSCSPGDYMTLLDSRAIALDRSDRMIDYWPTTTVNRCGNGILERCSLELSLAKSSIYSKPT